jgi:hypothetical protein
MSLADLVDQDALLDDEDEESYDEETGDAKSKSNERKGDNLPDLDDSSEEEDDDDDEEAARQVSSYRNIGLYNLTLDTQLGTRRLHCRRG